jgi:P-type Cu+ transporter
MATDPVCGMYVDERNSDLTLLRENRSYFFCSSVCLQQFAAPERELHRLRVRLLIAWPLAIAVVALTYGVHFVGWPWAAFGLATVVQFYPGIDFYRGTIDALRSRTWNMDVLIAVGSSTAYGYSAAALVLPGLVPQYYFDASAIIVSLILTGNYLEHYARDRASGSVRRLNELLPRTARTVREGREVDVPVAEVRAGDSVRVLPGERFPCDGTVTTGRTSVPEAMLTGEASPVVKAPGDAVLAGAVNGEGPVTIEATHVGQDTFLAQIGRLMTDAETSRVPLQRTADRIAQVFVPVVLGLAVAATIGWYVAGGVGVGIAVLVFVSVVITACPCAFGIATPAALLAGTGRAAEGGVLFKGSTSVEQASRVDVVVTDKTGTLTSGRPSLEFKEALGGEGTGELLALAAGLESGSEHSLGRAVVEEARRQGVLPVVVTDLRVEPGRGIRGSASGTDVAILTVGAARDSGADLTDASPWIERGERQGLTVSIVLRGGRAVGVLGFGDALATGVVPAIQALEREGVAIEMLTGDGEAAARRIAVAAGIDRFRSRMRPEDKLRRIRELRSQGHVVAYVGDGINDGPALLAADLGIAIGAGTDVAKEAGGVVLVRADFRGVVTALALGRRTVRKVRGNFAWALGYNAALLPVAMGALVPVFGFGVYRVLPFTGALAMAVSSTLVVLNSYTLRWAPI